ncbi:MAG: glutamine synthetase [Sphingomonas sp.]|nr:glutamine synthetase [Sphingomonas sp.]
MSGFVARHGLWSDAQQAAAERLRRRVADGGIEAIRFAFPDQHGILRGKTVLAGQLDSFLRGGCAITSTLLLKDTSHRTVVPLWTREAAPPENLRGGSDVVMVADPETFHLLPWAPGTAGVLCDLHHPDGRPVALATRHVARSALARLAEAGFGYLGGLEVELHVFRLVDARLATGAATQPGPAPSVALIGHGYQYLTDQRLDQYGPVLDIVRETCAGLALPLRTMELEFGPGQIELTFAPRPGLGLADDMVLLRSALKQALRRQGYHATFMCRPALDNCFSSGWHLHQSLFGADGGNAFAPGEGEMLSPVARRFAAGLLAHARDGCVLTTPTVTGYKRYRPHSLAPDGIAWGRDNRAAMLRIVPGTEPAAAHLENRVGDPAANPYLYLASQILAGLDGIAQAMEPPPVSETPYDGTIERLPASLAEAVALFRASPFWRAALGEDFVDYYARIKQAEVDRFHAQVTDWEQREYFDIF